MQKSSTGVIILNWKDPTKTLQALRSLATSTYLASHILVVNNASENDFATTIQQTYPKVDVLASRENLGFTGGNNLGMSWLLERGVEYILLLNDDSTLAPEALEILIEAALSHPEAGFLGPKVFTFENRERLLSAGGILDRPFRPNQRGLGQYDKGHYDNAEDVDYLSGCALMVNRKAIEAVGLLDDDFFAYYEDVEWCYRAGQKGFKCLYVPEAVAYHPDTRRRDNESPLVTYYMARNALLLARKHRLGNQVIVSMLCDHLRTLLAWSLRPKWKHKRRQRDALARALLDFARGRFGKAEGLP